MLSFRGVRVVLFCSLLPGVAGAAVSSDFDAGDEGWRSLIYDNLGIFQSDAGLAAHDGGFGNPAGSVATTDPGDDQAARFGAPAAYLGDLGAYLGGSISFDLIIKANPGPPSLPLVPGVVIFENAAANLAVGLIGELPTTGAWTSYGATLAPSAVAPSSVGFWASFAIDNPIPDVANNPASAADFATVFANVTRLSINGEVTDGTDDTLALDNVALNPVPLPAMLPAAACALLMLGGSGQMRRRRD